MKSTTQDQIGKTGSMTTHEVRETGTAVVYVRAARPGDNASLTAQAASLVERTKEHGVEARYVVTAVGSGVRPFEERDDLALLTELASSDWCDYIVTRSVDHISRSGDTFRKFLNELASHGVKLVPLDQGGDFNRDQTAHHHLFFGVMASVAELEHSKIAERMRLGRQARRASHDAMTPKGHPH